MAVMGRFPINHELLLLDKAKLVGEKAIAAARKRDAFEKFFRHTEIGELRKEAYGIIFVYESGDQKSYDFVVSCATLRSRTS